MHITHPFVSGKADGPDVTLVKPSDWNNDHKVVVSTTSVLGALTPGVVGEIPLQPAATGDDGTLWTKAQVQAAIAAAIAGIDIPVTGSVRASFAGAMPGWLLLNGTTIGAVGSSAQFPNASAQNLFNLFWNIWSGAWPVYPSRGSSAAFDWANGKVIAVPDARGAVLGMYDWGRGMNTYIGQLGVIAGEQYHSLAMWEMPGHGHNVLPAHNRPFNNGGGQYGGGAVMWDSGQQVYTDVQGGDGANWGSVSAHNNTQPTMSVFFWIKL